MNCLPQDATWLLTCSRCSHPIPLTDRIEEQERAKCTACGTPVMIVPLFLSLTRQTPAA